MSISLQSEIGKIVTLKSNHLHSIKQFENILLAGETNYITPLMVIKEVLDTKSDKIDEETGEVKYIKGRLQFRCTWFSNKSFKFEEGWFFQNELVFIENKDSKKLIVDIEHVELDKQEVEDNVKNPNEPSLIFGDTVILRTNHLELKKRQTHLEIDKEKSNNKVSALLNFCSPVFIFLGYASVEKKEPLRDSNTNSVKRAYCKKLVKLKAFNVKEDKYSEFLVPVEAIAKVSIPEKAIDEISASIDENRNENSRSLYLVNDDINFGVYNPKSILSVSNFYTLECENIFSQKPFQFLLNDNDFEKIDLPITKEFYPNIHSFEDKFLVKSILEYLQEIENENLGTTYMDIFHEQKKFKKDLIAELKLRIFKIGYKNKYEKYTNRFVIPIKLIDIERKGEKIKNISHPDEDKKEKDYYLRGYCLLRRDYRYFNITRMQYVEVYNSIELINVAINNWFSSPLKSKFEPIA